MPEQPDNFIAEIRFVKETQLTTCYYTLLLLFAIIALFKIPGTNPEVFITPAYWVIVILTVFSLIYQIHTAIALWLYRKEKGINTKDKK